MKIHPFPNRLLAALVATAALLPSCQKDIDLKIKPFEPKMVLSSFIAADSLISVHVSRTWTLGEDLPSDLLEDAELSIHINGLLQPPQQAIARAGDSVSIAVRKAGYPEVSAEVVVPALTPLLSIDTLRFKEAGSGPLLRCLIRFKDLEAGRKNYYRLIVEPEVYFQYSQDAALSEGFKDVNDEILGTAKDNLYGIFTDELFDGKEYTLNISFSPRLSLEEVRYSFKLVSLSPSAYFYYKSLLFHNSGDDYFTEPSAIYTNVANGLGIVGAYQTSTLSIAASGL
ncbi:MAG: DUF4249 domain-containing protein [Tannerellaceae bacterium]|jgi:hypothetical protein|nr:DUF4249 domain-containing protein [Tannerellaceae bacterium]